MQHWGRFPAWRPPTSGSGSGKARKETHRDKEGSGENIFMRWKEYFLVPDHRVRTISGASFEGFYYICFNQVTGLISGIYFHAKSEKYVSVVYDWVGDSTLTIICRYQQLELKHVEDHGCCAGFEFK